MKSDCISNIIFVLHSIIVLLIIFIPFSDNEKYLNLYISVIPFLFYHWSVNDDTCILTTLERKFRNIDSNEQTFLNRIISPVYKIPNNKMGEIAKTVTIILFYYVMVKTKRIVIT